MTKIILLLLLFLPSIGLSQVLDCKSIPYVFSGKVIATTQDATIFETVDKILINFENNTCKVYKDYNELLKAEGWTIVNE